MANRNPEEALRPALRLPLHKVVTRHNGLLFNAIAVASFLECAAPLHVNALTEVFAGDPEVSAWLERDWWGCKAEHGRALRAYLEATWPQFDWGCGYAEFYEACRPRVAEAYARRGRPHVALSLCAAAAQSAAFYRGLVRDIDDGDLREIFAAASDDEGRAFDYFRALFERLNNPRQLGLVAAYSTVVRSVTRARDGVVRLAFSCLEPHWYESPPFPQMTYPEFVKRMAGRLSRSLRLGPAQRLLFRPWLHKPAAAAAVPGVSRDGGCEGLRQRSLARAA